MKKLLFLILLIAPFLRGQDAARLEVQHTIERFFEGFHQKDSLKLKATVDDGVTLQNIGISTASGVQLRTEAFGTFLKSICSIPDSVSFREEIKDYDIRVDGPMAQAWTPYEFSLNGQFSHCGVNAFQLIEREGTWKIIYIIDTRRKEDCPW